MRLTFFYGIVSFFYETHCDYKYKILEVVVFLMMACSSLSLLCLCVGFWLCAKNKSSQR